jgi:hypothetical protein
MPAPLRKRLLQRCGCTLSPLLPESANRQRATTQTPQGVDATHGNELFPVNESRRSRRRASPQLRKNPGRRRLFRFPDKYRILAA